MFSTRGVRATAETAIPPRRNLPFPKTAPVVVMKPGAVRAGFPYRPFNTGMRLQDGIAGDHREDLR